MTNKSRWDIYTRNLPAPQSFLDFSYYFMISAALQRRVWFYGEDDTNEEGKLYANQYLVMVGPPGCGKGICLSKIAYFLRFHKYEKGERIKTSTGLEHRPLFPMGSDSITFEALLDDIADSSRAMVTPEKKPYLYTSYAFVLQELDSLFRKHADEVARFLKNAYDCGQYDRKTKHQGQALLRRLCCSLIAGTQLDFIKEAYEAKIFGQGFASRTLFLFESEERFSSFHISDIDDDQKVARDELLSWIKQLSIVYGELRYSKETRAWLEDWYHKKFIPRKRECGPKLVDYMARKKVIMLKLAAAMHFSENQDLIISTDTFERAIALLDSIEPSMEAGLSAGGRNKLHSIGRGMIGYIRERGKVGRRELILQYGADLTLEEIDLCLKELELGYNLKTTQQNNEKIYYL